MNLKELLGDKWRDDMTAEEISSALEEKGVDFSEAEPEKTENEIALETRIKNLERENVIIKRIEKLKARGVDDSTAKKMAEKLADGDVDGYMSLEEVWLPKYREKIESEITPAAPPATDGAGCSEDGPKEDIGVSIVKKIAEKAQAEKQRSDEIMQQYIGN